MVVVAASGGVDSAVLLLRARDQLAGVVWYNYGQPAALREWHALHAIVEQLGIPPATVYEVALTTLQLGAMATPGPGPRVVPHRNLVFLAHALNLAATLDAAEVWYGPTMEDHGAYPDCRPSFIRSINDAIRAQGPVVRAPLIELRKHEVVNEARSAGLLDYTWSCYEGGERPCGACASCRSLAGAGAL